MNCCNTCWNIIDELTDSSDGGDSDHGEQEPYNYVDDNNVSLDSITNFTEFKEISLSDDDPADDSVEDVTYYRYYKPVRQLSHPSKPDIKRDKYELAISTMSDHVQKKHLIKEYEYMKGTYYKDENKVVAEAYYKKASSLTETPKKRREYYLLTITYTNDLELKDKIKKEYNTFFVDNKSLL